MTYVVDTFPLGYGPEVLLLRLRALSGLVDRHVIVEANMTHSGRRRAPLWPQLAAEPRFREFVDRVLWAWLPTPQAFTPRQREEWLRDASLSEALRAIDLRGVQPERAMILMGDADEIPHPDALRMAISRGWERTQFYGRYHEWYLDWRTKGGPYRWEFRQPQLFYASDPHVGYFGGASIRQYQWSDERDVHRVGFPGTRFAHLAGWHFTLQGGPAACVDKLRSFAHTELSHLTERDVRWMIDARADILGRASLEDVPSRALPKAIFSDLDTFGPMLSHGGVDKPLDWSGVPA